MEFIKDLKRSHYCGELRSEHADQEVVLMGWVDNRRDHGGLIFIDLRDREGIAQVVFDPESQSLAEAKSLRGEFVIAVKGKLRRRPDGMINSKMPTGEVELVGDSLEIFSRAETPPFQINDTNVSEAVRLKYRYLDLRSKSLQSYLKTRHDVSMLVRSHLSGEGFYEVETPILYKSTPEGARDYLVPSRVNPGQFYALPQSPQILKQLLMVGGMDKYFQIARCFRDEDLRADRQPEFSQIDIEMSFIGEEDIYSLTETLVTKIWKAIKGVEITNFPRMTYKEAMATYGSDKPDLRNPLKIVDVAGIFANSGFKVFDDCVARGGSIRGVGAALEKTVSRSQIDKWTKLSKVYQAKGLVWIKNDGGTYQSPVSKFLSEDLLKAAYKEITGGSESGVALIVADDFSVCSAALGALRKDLGVLFGLIDTSADLFCWVTDFPLLDYDAENKRWVACHHPFTMPKDDDIKKMAAGAEQDLGGANAKAYDLVCNGEELAGGSIRIHQSEIQSLMFEALGFSKEDCDAKFGFFIEALKYGTPPHGGIAWGLDRLVMILCGTEAIRDVIAFPKTAKALDLMASAPGEVDAHQLLELGIRLRK